MASKMDMSLDDIIKQTRTSRGGGGGRGRGSPRGGRRGGGQNNRRNSNGEGTTSAASGSGGVYRGGVNRNERLGNRRGGDFFNQRTREVPDDRWQHDLYDGSQEPPRRESRGPSAVGSGKLLVSNLDFGVSDSDIKELFSEFGPLIKAAVHFDRSGRSLGTAEVIYQRGSDAAKAMKEYNNIPLDGLHMSIQLIGATPQRSINSRLGPRNETNKPPAGRGNFRGGNRGGRRQDKQLPTLEDLDAQLDAYNAKMEVDNS